MSGLSAGARVRVASSDGAYLYAGLGDGRIVRLNKELTEWETVARTGGTTDAAVCGENGSQLLRGDEPVAHHTHSLLLHCTAPTCA